MDQGPPWIQSSSGYFLAGSNSAGLISQPWTSQPSVDLNQSSSTSPSLIPARTSALTSTSFWNF